MRKQKIETAVPDVAEGKRLNHAEAMDFVLAERDLQTAMLAEKHQTMLLRAQELEAHVALTATKQQVEKCKADFAQAQAKHKRLKDHLAATYKFDWHDSCFDPITGLIQALPTENGLQKA